MHAAFRSTQHAQRLLAWLLLALSLFVSTTVSTAVSTTAFAQDPAGPPAPPDPICTCATGRACFHYLRAPHAPPEGSCWCAACDPDRPHAGNKTPPGWNRVCFKTKNEARFLRRHAASWRLICSGCTADTKSCRQPSPATCPQCQTDGKSPFPRQAAERAAQQLAIERRVFNKRAPVVVWSRRFYVVTDVQKMRIATQKGGMRWASGHEYAHIMLERAETAYRDFSRAIGGVRISRPVGIFLPAQDGVGRKLRAAYFRNARVHMIYGSLGGSRESNIAGGFCLNGLSVSAQQVGNKDRAWHQAVRHNLGHIFVSNWIKTQGENRTLPRWMFTGAGHWLGKWPAFLRDEVFFCEGEGRRTSGSGKGWLAKCRGLTAKRGFGSVEEWLAKDSLGQLTYRDHLRSWGYFHLALSEWRRPWVGLLGDLRREKDVRPAFENRLALTPEEFHDRWAARLSGKITHLDPTKSSGSVPTGSRDADAPTTGWDTSLPPRKLAAALRAAPVPQGLSGVNALLTAIAQAEPKGGDLVRETALQILLKVKAKAARTALIERGLTHASPVARAFAARVCRRRKLLASKDALRTALTDPHWLVRSEAALGSAALRDFDAQARIRAMVEDASPKARIAAMDALREFGEDVNPICVPVITKNLSHRDWQVRIAACQTLAEVGDRHAVGPLVARWQIESGRVAEEIHTALRNITGDDLGRFRHSWKEWWDKEEQRVKERGGFAERPAPKDDGRYGTDTPTTYGIRLFSQRVGFVIDVSGSTKRAFALDAATEKRLTGAYPEASVLGMFQGEVLSVLKKLDPRARLSLVAFGSEVRRWKKGTVSFSGANRSSALRFVKNRQPAGETNFHGALLEVLDLATGERGRSGFGDTPDTITFLTDGSPTVGDVTDPDTLLDWYTEWNRYARVRTHVVVYGSLGVDEDLLQSLATRNDGAFVQIRESHGR